MVTELAKECTARQKQRAGFRPGALSMAGDDDKYPFIKEAFERIDREHEEWLRGADFRERDAAATEEVTITVTLPPQLGAWMLGFVGRKPEFADPQQTIITALRCMAGRREKDGMTLNNLLSLLTGAKQPTTRAEIMYGPHLSPEHIKIANILLEAAFCAFNGCADVIIEHVMPEDERDAIYRAWSAAAGPGRDIAAEVAEARAEVEADLRAWGIDPDE